MSKKKSWAEKNREIEFELKKAQLDLTYMELQLKRQQAEREEFRMKTLQEAMDNLKFLIPHLLNWMDDHRVVVQPKSPTDVQ